MKHFGYVDQSITTMQYTPPRGAPGEYYQTVSGASRLLLNIRLQSGMTQLDTKALKDIDRIVEYLNTDEHKSKKIILVGFSHSFNNAEGELVLSNDIVQKVDRKLREKGITPIFAKGFGAALPLMQGDSPQAREKNQRVEVWIR